MAAVEAGQDKALLLISNAEIVDAGERRIGKVEMRRAASAVRHWSIRTSP
jgi:hypothetical protein